MFYRPILTALCRNHRAMWLHSQNTYSVAQWLLWRAQHGGWERYRASRRSREQFSSHQRHLHHNHFGSLIWKITKNKKPFLPKNIESSICWVIKISRALSHALCSLKYGQKFLWISKPLQDCLLNFFSKHVAGLNAWVLSASVLFKNYKTPWSIFMS